MSMNVYLLVVAMIGTKVLHCIDLDVYYDTQCRYSRKTIDNVIEAKRMFGDRVQVQLYPIENPDNDWDNYLTCTYRPEFDEIRLHVCLAEHANITPAMLAVVRCLIANGTISDGHTTWFDTFEFCAKSVLSRAQIADLVRCYEQRARELIDNLRVKMSEINLDFVPLLDVNRKYLKDVVWQGAILKNLPFIICNELDNDQKPEICLQNPLNCLDDFGGKQLARNIRLKYLNFKLIKNVWIPKIMNGDDFIPIEMVCVKRIYCYIFNANASNRRVVKPSEDNKC